MTEAGTPSKGLSRRRFLTSSAAVAITGVVTAIAGSSILGEKKYPNPMLTPSKTSTPNYEATLHKALSGTATAVKNENRETSFVPEAGFTEEMVNKIREGLFVMVFEKKDKFVGGATGSIVGNSKEGSILLTATHVIKEVQEKGFTRLRLYQPFSGKNEIVFSSSSLKNVGYEGASPDISVVQVPTFLNIQPLLYEENPIISEGEKVLVTGYPAEFWNADRSQMPTSALVGEITYSSRESKNNNWIARGFTNAGSSGSPVFRLKNGTPVMVGVLSTTTPPDMFGGFPTILQPLIKSLKD